MACVPRSFCPAAADVRRRISTPNGGRPPHVGGYGLPLFASRPFAAMACRALDRVIIQTLRFLRYAEVQFLDQPRNAAESGDGEDLRIEFFVVPQFGKVEANRSRLFPLAGLDALDEPGGCRQDDGFDLWTGHARGKI